MAFPILKKLIGMVKEMAFSLDHNQKNETSMI